MNQIKWTNRYSFTLEDDKFGRWAAVGYAGNFKKIEETYQICWISKVKLKDIVKFQVKPDFPYKDAHLFDSVESAKESVEIHFKKFIKSVNHEPKT